MLFRNKIFFLLFFLIPPVFAFVPSNHEKELVQVQLSSCLYEKIDFSNRILAENKKFKIIEFSYGYLEGLNHLADKNACGRFLNISHHFEKGLTKKQVALSLLSALPKKAISMQPSSSLTHQKVVQELIDHVDTDYLWDNLSSLVHFTNRSATTSTGVEAAEWVKNRFESMAKEQNNKNTKSYFVSTGKRFQQPSVVSVIGADLDQPAIVIGAHLDTLSGNMPGADDDGSGAAAIMEIARILLVLKPSLTHPVYIIWYAAEEEGLVGSQQVTQYFEKKKIPVQAVMQLDLAGYRAKIKDPTLWIYTDDTDKNLNGFLAQLITTYIKVPIGYSKCGYACSDHVSWTNIGVPAVFPVEARFDLSNPYIHSANDTLEHISLEHLSNFTKLGLAFIGELAS